MKILVIGGGISDEREVSLRSAQSVFDAIGAQHQKILYDWKGEEKLNLKGQAFDVALPILHGPGGEDGHIQRILENTGMRYLGSDVASSKVCIDKVQTQRTLSQHGVLVPIQALANAQIYNAHALAQKPHVLKPIEGGSSLDTFVCLDGPIDMVKQAEVFAKYPEMIIEQYIAGTEFTVPVLDGYDLPVIKIVPPDGFFDYENKYSGATQEICEPDDIDASTQQEARRLSKQCHDILKCRHLSRVDIILDAQGAMYVLEVNTMPGLTDQSLFPKAAAHVGLTMPELVEYFVTLASGQPTRTQ